jgi:hypothetical protein
MLQWSSSLQHYILLDNRKRAPVMRYPRVLKLQWTSWKEITLFGFCNEGKNRCSELDAETTRRVMGAWNLIPDIDFCVRENFSTTLKHDLALYSLLFYSKFESISEKVRTCLFGKQTKNLFVLTEHALFRTKKSALAFVGQRYFSK